MTTAFFFPGQGSQFPGMARDIANASPAAREVLREASDVLKIDARGLLGKKDDENSAENFKRADNAQMALAVAELAVAACLAERGIIPSACAGHSAGEYPALACAGALTRAGCLALVAARGLAMQAAIEKIRASEFSAQSKSVDEDYEGAAPGMAAVVGLPPESVASLAAEWNGKNAADAARKIYAANFNSPRQTAVSGSGEALADAAQFFKAAGARRVVRLPVAGPFHSPFMKEAAEAFAPALEKIQFKNPALPFFSNVTGREEKSGEALKALALRQLCEPVRWTEIEAAVSAKIFSGGEDAQCAVVEAGPGAVLQGLWRDAGSAVPVYGAGTMPEILAIADILKR